jgi:hypothetical protein
MTLDDSRVIEFATHLPSHSAPGTAVRRDGVRNGVRCQGSHTLSRCLSGESIEKVIGYLTSKNYET